MKITLLGTALGCVLILAGCQQATSSSSSSSSSSHFTDQVSSTTAYNYYDLSTGKTVSDPTTQKWDIAFGYGTQQVFTNSGDSSTASGGSGGVYYSGKTDFSSVSSFDTSKIGSSDVWSRDRSVTQNQVYGSSTPYTTYASTTLVLNAMTELYYSEGGDGSSGNPYTAYLGPTGSLTDAWTQSPSIYYNFDGATSYTVTNRVYIVKSGDGSSYYKVQISSLTKDGSNRDRIVIYSKL
jgi:hypothetical protein